MHKQVAHMQEPNNIKQSSLGVSTVKGGSTLGMCSPHSCQKLETAILQKNLAANTFTYMPSRSPPGPLVPSNHGWRKPDPQPPVPGDLTWLTPMIFWPTPHITSDNSMPHHLTQEKVGTGDPCVV